MSRLTPCFRCGRSRGSHFTYDGHDDLDHAFVEPAPQPPADARQMPEVPCTCITAHDRAVCQGWCKPKPAAPPVSGDGDDAVVREIANRHVSAGNCCFTNTMVLVREALQRGRALGAREERDGVEKQLRKQADEHERIAAANPDIAEPQMIRANCLWTEADAIARRSGGQGK